MFDYTEVLDKDLARGLRNIAKRATNDGLALGLSISLEDVASELYMVILVRPELHTYPLFKSLGILKGEATRYVNELRNQEGGFFTSPESLVDLLFCWRSEGGLMPSVRDALFGPVFARAGSPAGSYRDAIVQAYRDGLVPPARSSEGKKLKRAVVRLSEVLTGVLVGPVKSLDEHEVEVGLIEDCYSYAGYEDSSVGSFGAIYVCSSGHLTKLALAVDPPEVIGMPRVYGYLNCSCGEVLKLAE